MNPFQEEEDAIRNEIKSWRTFANYMNNECEKKEFEGMVNNYCAYSQIIIDAGWESFHSKPLVLNLLFFQYRKIMQWLFNKTVRN
jgi:hypothetical protein